MIIILFIKYPVPQTKLPIESCRIGIVHKRKVPAISVPTRGINIRLAISPNKGMYPK